MSVATELQRIIDAKDDLKTAIEAKGVTVPASALIDDYPALVDSIPTGGGLEQKTVNFYDYEGTLVASYTGVEAQALTELPSPPDHSNDEVPLTFDEWNWTLAEIKANNTACPEMVIDVGANYHTTDGKIHAFFDIVDSSVGYCSFYAGNANGTVDWGDGTTENVSYGDNGHTYSQIGKYHCTITSTMSYINFGNQSPRIFAYNLIKAFLPSTITTFQSGFFGCCEFLEKVNLPSGLSLSSTTHSYIFYKCERINCIVIPRATTRLRDSSYSYAYFYSCSAKIFSVPGCITEMSNTPKKLYNITFPSGVTSLVTNFTNDVIGIKKLVLPNTISSIGGNTFYRCSDLEEIVFLANVTEIPSGFLYGPNFIRKITIPNYITSIGASAFYGCKLLQSIVMSASGITSIGASAFYECSAIKKIELPTTVTSIGQSCFYGCTSLYTISIPNGVTELLKNTFYNCSSLTSIVIPNLVTSIGNNCFYGCSALVEITLSSSLSTIGGSVFNGCNSLTTITSLATIPPTCSSTLPSSLTKIYVPYSSDHSVLAAYQSATNWSNFASIMEELPE